MTVELFHTGIRVPSLDAAMSELGGALGLTWAVPNEVPAQPVWTPDLGSREVRLRFTYSVEGEHHVELLESEPGSPWFGDDLPGSHHVGRWVDDVVESTDRLVADGWRLAIAHRSPDDGLGLFSYVESPSGVLVELVDRSIAPAFERWWAASLG